MSARAYVETDFQARGVRVFLSPDEGLAIVGIGAFTVETVPEGAQADPAFVMPDDLARALYAALAEHYGHSGHDIRALRQDYDAERARVDRMIGYLIDQGPGVPGPDQLSRRQP